MGKKLADGKGLDKMLRAILFNGKKIPYNPDDYTIYMGIRFGYLKNKDGEAANLDRNQFVASSFLNMDLVMERFIAIGRQ